MRLERLRRMIRLFTHGTDEIVRPLPVRSTSDDRRRHFREDVRRSPRVNLQAVSDDRLAAEIREEHQDLRRQLAAVARGRD